LLFKSYSDLRPIRLAIENESEILCFRENLRMLSRAPGLRLKVVARVNLQEPTIVSPLAVAPMERDPRTDDEPRLDIPESFAGRICLGFDEIQRHFLINARPSPVVLIAPDREHETENPLDLLERRWIAKMLSGLVSQGTTNAKTLVAEATTLDRLGFATGAALLDALCSTRLDRAPSGTDTFLAAGTYLRICRYELGRSKTV
jgi:hypothetical protein